MGPLCVRGEGGATLHNEGKHAAALCFIRCATVVLCADKCKYWDYVDDGKISGTKGSQAETGFKSRIFARSRFARALMFQ